MPIALPSGCCEDVGAHKKAEALPNSGRASVQCSWLLVADRVPSGLPCPTCSCILITLLHSLHFVSPVFLVTMWKCGLPIKILIFYSSNYEKLSSLLFNNHAVVRFRISIGAFCQSSGHNLDEFFGPLSHTIITVENNLLGTYNLEESVKISSSFLMCGFHLLAHQHPCSSFKSIPRLKALTVSRCLRSLYVVAVCVCGQPCVNVCRNETPKRYGVRDRIVVSHL